MAADPRPPRVSVQTEDFDLQREIEALEAQLAATRVKMNGYLRELGVVA